MSRSIFGWNYPAGAENDPRAPWNQVDPPCEVCGKHTDDCICPTCDVCGETGRPECYRTDEPEPDELPGCGLEKTEEQIKSLAASERDPDYGLDEDGF